MRTDAISAGHWRATDGGGVRARGRGWSAMGSSVPGGWRGSACSGGGGRRGGEEGTTRDRSILAADGRRDRGRGREGGGESAPRAAGTSTPPSGIPSAASRDRRRRLRSAGSSACAPPLAFARRLRGGGCGGGCGGRVSRRARGAICKTNARDDRGDGAAFRADPRGAAPGDRSTRRATARSRTRRDRGPRASPSAARGARIGVPRGGKKTKKLRALFSRASGTHDCRHRRRPAPRGRGRRTRRPRAAWACRTSRAGSRAPRRSTARALDAQ